MGCDVGVTKEDDLVGGSERQIDKETVVFDDGTMSEASDSERCEGVAVEQGVVGEAMRHIDKGTDDTARTPEDDPVGRSERQVDKETVGCDVGVTKEDDLVGGSERQVDKETVGVMLE